MGVYFSQTSVIYFCLGFSCCFQGTSWWGRWRRSKCPFKAQEHASDSRQRPYRLWYTIEVQALAPPPERTLEVTCATHFVVAVDMAVTNATRNLTRKLTIWNKGVTLITEMSAQPKSVKLCFGHYLTWKLTIWNECLTLITKMNAY